MKPAPAAKGDQDAGITQPREHSLADPCTHQTAPRPLSFTKPLRAKFAVCCKGVVAISRGVHTTYSLAVPLEDGGVGPLAELLQLNVRLELSERRVALKTRGKGSRVSQLDAKEGRKEGRKEGLIMQISFRFMILSLATVSKDF